MCLKYRFKETFNIAKMLESKVSVPFTSPAHIKWPDMGLSKMLLTSLQCSLQKDERMARWTASGVHMQYAVSLYWSQSLTEIYLFSSTHCKVSLKHPTTSLELQHVSIVWGREPDRHQGKFKDIVCINISKYIPLWCSCRLVKLISLCL